MNPILKDFILDLDRLRKILKLIELLILFPSNSEANTDDSEYSKSAKGIHDAAINCHSGMPVLIGTLLLYLAGRFENFVKETFEDLCDTLAHDCQEFSHLPKQMRNNLIILTAEVVSHPRKYGHADNGVTAFINTLADNLNGLPLVNVNSKCLSITSENMWPDTIREIYARIGVTNVWDRLGQQACLQTYFQTEDVGKTTHDSKSRLKTFMELRNKIAHPSGTLEWPSPKQLETYIDFISSLSQAIADITGVCAAALPVKNQGVQQS